MVWVCVRPWCLIIPSGVVSLVSRKDVTPGGILRAISLMSSSVMMPGPLGMFPTIPSAEAPAEMAILASS
jgi:hypothetical protein